MQAHMCGLIYGAFCEIILQLYFRLMTEYFDAIVREEFQP